MKTYTGTKTINAKPMNRADYNTFRGWIMPSDENGDDEGYLVEYTDGGKPNIPGFTGYVSWSPKDVFERSYKEVVASTRPAYQSIESEIIAKGLTAPRVTPADIEANIASEYCFTAAEGVAGHARGGRVVGDPSQPLHLLTFCVLVLKNGYTVTGESACASPGNFDAEMGRKIARQNAVQNIWPLMGYALKERLFQMTQPAQAPD